MKNSARVRLVIVHSHYRPGGVRRVIELALPALAGARRPGLDAVVLAGGEAPDAAWLAALRASVPGVDVTCAIAPAAGYRSEARGPASAVARRVRAFAAGLLGGARPADTVVWAHNLGLGRNLTLARALTQACARRGVPLVAHHHDWWFDNRWQRWPEMRRAGFGSLGAVARTVFAAAPTVRHATINRGDHRILARHLGARAGWLPNLAAAPSAPPTAAVRQAQDWLRETLGGRAPVWLVPCRLLRRKNLAEALLLTRWLRPEAWLVTTGGVSSADERAYADTLRAAGMRHGWRLRLGVLAEAEAVKPAVPALLAASEVVLLTSLQEGFGLPNLEAAAAGRPLIVRTLPNIAPDLATFGFRFPQAYDEVWIERGLFDARAETARQERRWQAWRAGLPRRCRALAGRPPWLDAGGGPVAFSRLTLTAQLQVLAHAPEDSWARCAALNPLLRRWRSRAGAGALAASRWPHSAERWLGAAAYARRFAQLLHAAPGAVADDAPERIADEFFRAKLAWENQYPLLWSRAP
ncbi:MAG: glycosyltransferase [Verrucomicrobia bacterium]|nr:glycosyltransferase [Verrucomicrobiota bacterium]